MPTFFNDDIEESDFIEPDDEVPPEIPDDDPVDSTGKAVYEQPVTDLLLNAKVFLPQGEELKSATVKCRSRDDNGDVVGEYDPNPYLNTLVYDVEFNDGTVREYSANVIAQNMYEQVDSEGFSYNVLDSIVDYKMDSTALMPHQTHVYTRSGQKRLRKSTKGCSEE